MRIVCPCCGGIFSAEAGLGDAHARQVFRQLAELPASASKPVLHYLALFRNPEPRSRGLRWDKISRLLAELAALISETHIQAKGKAARPNVASAWGRAMEQMTEHPPQRLPLKSHGYLQAVAYDICNDLDRAAEVKRNKDERTGQHRRPGPAPARKKGKYSTKYPTAPPMGDKPIHELTDKIGG